MPHKTAEARQAYYAAYYSDPANREHRRNRNRKYMQDKREDPPIRATKFNTKTIAPLLRNWSTP